MQSKFLGLFAISILAFAFLMSFASAALTFVPDTITQDVLHDGEKSTTINFQVDNTETSPVLVDFSLTSSPAVGSWTLPSSITIINGTSESFSATFSGIPSDFIDAITSTIKVENSTLGLSDELTVTITVTAPTEVTTCNNVKNPGELRVKSIDFNNEGMGDTRFGDDDEWFPLDEVEVEIEIENNGDFDVDDIEVEWGIYNTRTDELIIEFEDEKDFNLKDGKDEILTINFQLEDDLDVDLEDLTDGKDYRFYVTARGTIDDSKAGSLDGEDTCVSDFETAEVIIENDFVVLSDIQFPETVQCGADVQITAKVWNIGDDDQDEVKVEVHNNDLGLFHKTVEIGDIDAFDDDAYSFNFKVPSDAEEKTHTLEFKVLDEDFDVYENDFDDDESKFFLPFRVSGGCVGEIAEVTISATLESEAKAGEDLVVRAIITNNGDELSTFTVNAAGFVPWANSVSIDQTTLVLNAGESRNILFTFDVSKDASGSQSFTIELVSDDNQVTTQPVSVTIEPRSRFGITGNLISGENLPWVIGALNIILVIIIIIVAVRVARK